MNELLRQLVELTEVDREIVRTREQLVHYPAMLTRLAALEAEARHEAEQVEAQLKAARHDRGLAEKEVATLRDRITKYQSQQSAVKTNKEYQAMTAEIEGARASIDDWESRGLEVLMREDALADRRAATRKKIELLTAENTTERQRIQTQASEKQARLAQLDIERARRLEAIPEPSRDQYDLLNQHFPGSACAPLDHESCGGCHWHLVAHTCQLVRQDTELVECDHCRRILYAPDGAHP